MGDALLDVFTGVLVEIPAQLGAYRAQISARILDWIGSRLTALILIGAWVFQ